MFLASVHVLGFLNLKSSRNLLSQGSENNSVILILSSFLTFGPPNFVSKTLVKEVLRNSR